MKSSLKIQDFILSDEMKSKNKREAALAYAAYMPVFPIWWCEEGKCACSKKSCSNPAKHPIIQNGFKGASQDPDQINAWWKKYPRANIGSPLTKGLVVLDVDGEKGLKSFKSLGIKTKTLKAVTSRGFHLYYLGNLATRNNAMPGLDIRGGGEGGYIILPPSTHISGKRYYWEV